VENEGKQGGSVGGKQGGSVEVIHFITHPVMCLSEKPGLSLA
jgi:hypothetical protein